MANQGILAQSKPAANTNTLFYSAPIDSSASAVLNVANDGTGAAIDVALKDYDQKLTVGASTYKLHEGDVISDYQITVDTPFAENVGFTGGQLITSGDKEKTFKFESIVAPSFVTIYVKSFSIRQITVESVTGTFAIGQTISKGTSPNDTVATIYGISGTILYVGPSTINGTGAEFTDADSITGSGGATAVVSTGGVATAANKFAFSTTTSGGTYSLKIGGTDTLALFNDRAYRFDVSDSSMNGLLFKISTTFNGEWGPDGTYGNADDGTEYTSGKTTSGTAGQSNAYIQYDFPNAVGLPTLIYWYEGTVATAGNSSYGASDAYLTTDAAPTFTSFYVYDVTGTWTTSDTFLFSGVTYTTSTISSGPYGYVRDYTGTSLKVIKGVNSADFTTSDTFRDSPLDGTSTRTEVTIGAVAVATANFEAEHAIIDGVTVGANAINRTTSLVVGPGERLIINSATQNNAFTLMGFEDATAFATRTYYTNTSGT